MDKKLEIAQGWLATMTPQQQEQLAKEQALANLVHAVVAKEAQGRHIVAIDSDQQWTDPKYLKLIAKRHGIAMADLYDPCPKKPHWTRDHSFDFIYGVWAD